LRVKEDTLPVQLQKGALISTANLFDVTAKTISKIWKKARQSFQDLTIFLSVAVLSRSSVVETRSIIAMR
jgi:hypothetical protein